MSRKHKERPGRARPPAAARSQKSFAAFQDKAFAPVDIASLVFFRVAFGSLLVWHVCSFLARGLVGPSWLQPRFLFKYYGFSWVHPWPGPWLYFHWGAVALLALLVAVGCLYRPSAVLLCLSYVYFFLLDQARYVNHTYLISLFSFLLIFVPAHRSFSVVTFASSVTNNEPPVRSA